MDSPEIVDTSQALPRAIWIPTHPEPAVYRGVPLEMVRAMADEMGDISTRDAIDLLVDELAFSRKILIDLCNSDELPEEGIAHLFVYALLDTGIARPLPQA
jgi:hypothetical protein